MSKFNLEIILFKAGETIFTTEIPVETLLSEETIKEVAQRKTEDASRV